MDDDALLPPVAPVPVKASHGWATARRRLAELLIVFVGVYAAFLLNRFDTDRRDARRRAQILEAFEQEISTSIQELREDIAVAEAAFADFDRRLVAGEMPPLGVSFTDTGYSASDDATLLQAGGLELLDMQTIELVRQVNTLERSLLAFTHDQFELSLVELANHSSEDFYDPATHQLKKRYDWYPQLRHSMLKQAKDLLTAEEKLLARLQANRGSRPGAVSPARSRAGQTTPSRSPAAPSPAA